MGGGGRLAGRGDRGLLSSELKEDVVSPDDRPVWKRLRHLFWAPEPPVRPPRSVKPPALPTSCAPHTESARSPAYPSWSERTHVDGDPLDTLRRILRSPEARHASTFTEKLWRLALEGDPTFPVFPRAALDLDLALRRTNVAFDELAKIVRTDPGLVERIIRRASSAGTGSSVPDLGTAFARLGTTGVWRVAMASVLDAPVFRSSGWAREADLARRVAMVTGELAASSLDPRVDPGVAYLVGTLHELGTLQILRHAPRDMSPHLLRQLLSSLSPALGRHVVEGWKLDPRVAPAIGALGAEDFEPTRRAVRVAQMAAHAAVLGDVDSLESLPDELAEEVESLVAYARRLAA